MAFKWAIKELLASVKLNQLNTPHYTTAEQVAILDANRVKGMTSYNTDDETLQVYQSGTGSNFFVSELTNKLFRNETNIGIGSTLTTVYDVGFVNQRGKMNTFAFCVMEYLLEASLVFEITFTVDDGVSPINDTISGTAGGSPVKTIKVFKVDTSSFTIDDILQLQIKVKNAQIEFVEMRGF